MKPNRRVPLIVLTLGLIAGLAALALHARREPRYKGKSLSAWLKAYRYRPIGTPVPVSQEAADAVRHIGTNALPFLVRWIQEEQDIPKWKEPLLRPVYRWKLSTARREGLLELLAGRQFRATRALWGFRILGETAAPAIPDLVRVANQGNPKSAKAAIVALNYLGKDALAPLLCMTTNSASPLRNQALWSVGQMRYLGTNAHPAVVLLIQYLGTPDHAAEAAYLLGSLGVESEISVPALARCVHSDNDALRTYAARSLGRFGSSASPAVPELLKMLDDPSASIRNEATNALQQIAPGALRKTEPQ